MCNNYKRKEVTTIPNIDNKVEIEQYLLDNPKAGQREVAKYFNVSVPTLKLRLDRFGLETASMKQKRLNKEKTSKITKTLLEELYFDLGMSQREIAEKMGLEKSTIRRYFKKYGLAARTMSEAKQQYSINSNYFSTIDSHQKAYFLGLILADGWVSRRGDIGISLQPRDIALIEGLKKELESEHPITYKRTGDTDYPTLCFKNKKMIEDLAKYGVIPNKTEIIDFNLFIGDIAEEYWSSLLLGYFDGDGSVVDYIMPNNTTHQYSCSVTGTMEVCRFYQDYFSDSKSRIYKRHDNDVNNYSLQISSRGPTKAALKMLYTNVDKLHTYLQRKYDIYITL